MFLNNNLVEFFLKATYLHVFIRSIHIFEVMTKVSSFPLQMQRR